MKDAKLECNEEFRNKNPPTCPNCKKIARPNVLMFDDYSFSSERRSEQEEKYKEWIDDLYYHKQQIRDLKLCCIEIGAGKAIPTVRMQSELMTQTFEGSLIRINIRDPEIPDNLENCVGIPLGGKEALMKIEEELKKL